MATGAIYFAAFLGGQRYLLESLYSYACVIPIFFALLNWSDFKRRNTYLVLSVFLSVDITAGVYAGTPSVLRYFIYIVAFFVILEGFKVDLKNLAGLLLLLLLWSFFSLYNLDIFEFLQAYKDIQILLVLLVVFARATSSLQSYELDMDIIKWSLVFVMLSEIVNLFLFHDLAGGYLSLNSTKAFICGAFFIALSQRKVMEVIFLLPLTVMVVIAYGQRMILLVFIVLASFSLFFAVIRSRKLLAAFFWIFAPVVIMAFFVISGLDIASIEGNRSIRFIISLGDGVNLDVIRALDPVRYDEHQLFFGRDIITIVFGGGIGTGLHDVNNLLGYVNFDEFGFSESELSSGIFFGFHDYWTSIGLRFGILAAILPLFVLLKLWRNNSGALETYSKILIIMILCSFYSISGLLIIALLALSYRSQLARSINEKRA